MKQRCVAGPVAVALAAGLLLINAPAGAQPRRDRENGPRTAAGAPMFRQRTTTSTLRSRTTVSGFQESPAPGVMLGARRPSVDTRYRFARGTAFRRARMARYRRNYGGPFGYIYAAPPAYNYYYDPPVTYYYNPPVTYYYNPYSGYYYTTRYRRHRHHRYRMRVAGYRAYYTAAPPGWSHGRKRGWRGSSVPPGLRRHGWR